eukprot:120504-Amphidinium_carterae.1
MKRSCKLRSWGLVRSDELYGNGLSLMFMEQITLRGLPVKGFTTESDEHQLPHLKAHESTSH